MSRTSPAIDRGQAMKNIQLETAMHAKGLNPARLAEIVGADQKTVERWISTGRVPRQDNQWRVASALVVEPSYLWPPQDDDPAPVTGASELVAVYAHRGEVPHHLWTGLIDGPTTSIRVLVYAGLPWFETDPTVLEDLRARADAGVKIRLALGDPDCAAVALRGQEEHIDMAARIRNALHVIGRLVDHPGIEVRLHDTTLYASLYMADNELLANHHILGVPAAQAPIAHLRRAPGGFLFDRYCQGFDQAWAGAREYHRAEA